MSQKHIDILMDARRQIELKERDHICHAVKQVDCGSVYLPEEKLSQGAREILEHIRRLLDGSYTLDIWLAQNNHALLYLDNDSLRATRLAWIDDMIEYWRNKP